MINVLYEFNLTFLVEHNFFWWILFN